ncbi:MAG: PEP/pyruvate-binding domain-containing protein, partial [Brevibacterium aurantiacum]|nr:PEP/pyruvate-binding domain-containing protein [Brevibacterium aurantiacum]
MAERASTGSPGLDETVDGLRIGDNVVWRVDSIADFGTVVELFAAQARTNGRRLIHVRFGQRDVLPGMESITLDPSVGFERFAVAVHQALTDIGPLGFYVFDPLADLHLHWHSDLQVMNLFKVTCPYLFELDTIAYFALLRDQHTRATVTGIRETTQLFLDLHHIEEELYVHPLKVWKRHSPTMFFPHRLDGGNAISITSSNATTQLFATLARPSDPVEPWQRRIEEAWDALEADDQCQNRARDMLRSMLIGNRGRMSDLCRRYLTLTDLLAVAARQIGTGSIGGKSVGMLTARAILEHGEDHQLSEPLEPHDSHYIGSDVFVGFLVGNGWWDLWMRHRDDEEFREARRLHALIPMGHFPRPIREQFVEMLEYYGQAPIIVRSSSLLEDNYGNAFAGKYDSVLLTNQGTPDERLSALQDAVRTVYASIVSEPALRYRAERGLLRLDEEMAVLVQRISGDQHDDWFLPAAAGVANSSSLYVWQPGLPDQGMARLVVGLGTRAVDRTGQDFARIVALADPALSPVPPDDVSRYSQRRVDLLDVTAQALVAVPIDRVRGRAPGLPWTLVSTPDPAAARRMRELGRRGPPPEVIDFAGLLTQTEFPALLRGILGSLSAAYDYPVDIEFTVNVDRDGAVKMNLVQCRPLQTGEVGPRRELPAIETTRCFIATTGAFMGGNASAPIDLVVSVRPDLYLALGEPDRYRVARAIGALNRSLDSRNALLAGPGRWGTSTPSLGVPT